MIENKETPTQQEESTDYRKMGVIGLRFMQMIAISIFVVGFIWGGTDFLNSLIPENNVVTPMSVLLMMYGVIGASVIEVAIRVVQRKK